MKSFILPDLVGNRTNNSQLVEVRIFKGGGGGWILKQGTSSKPTSRSRFVLYFAQAKSLLLGWFGIVEERLFHQVIVYVQFKWNTSGDRKLHT
jgi:hypothetical protein